MNVEFIYPPDSSEVLFSADLNAVPGVAQKVNHNGKHYRVYSVEWCLFEDRKYEDPSRVGVLINLLLDEIEEHAKR